MSMGVGRSRCQVEPLARDVICENKVVKASFWQKGFRHLVGLIKQRDALDRSRP